jgi:hypothetical protein
MHPAVLKRHNPSAHPLNDLRTSFSFFLTPAFLDSPGRSNHKKVQCQTTKSRFTVHAVNDNYSSRLTRQICQKHFATKLARKLYPTATSGNQRRVSARSAPRRMPTPKIFMYTRGSRAGARNEQQARVPAGPEQKNEQTTAQL